MCKTAGPAERLIADGRGRDTLYRMSNYFFVSHCSYENVHLGTHLLLTHRHCFAPNSVYQLLVIPGDTRTHSQAYIRLHAHALYDYDGIVVFVCGAVDNVSPEMRKTYILSIDLSVPQTDTIIWML